MPTSKKSNQSSKPFKSVIEFATWFINQPLGKLIPFMRPNSTNYGPIARSVLFRNQYFQVEMWTVWPGETQFPEHNHPDVDTVEIHLSGDLRFTLNGNPIDSNLLIPLKGGGALPAIRINHDDTHQASAGIGGAMFLSCQQWLNDVNPNSVALNWEGEHFTDLQDKLKSQSTTETP